MKRIAILIFLSTLLILSGCRRGAETAEETPVPVQVFTVHPDSISTYLEVTGSLEAGNDALVYSKLSDKLIEIRKNVGDWVKKDEIIAVLENRLGEEGMNQARAALRSMEARYRQIKSDYERYERLYREKAVSDQQWEKIRSAMQEAEANLTQLRAAYHQAKEQYENSFIKAPFDGRVGSLFFDEGQTVPMGQPVVRIVNTRLMKARLNIPDIHLHKLRVGQQVLAEFPSLPGKVFRGRINRIDSAIDPMSRTARAEVIFANETSLLQSGMYGLFRVETEKRSQAIVVPDNAIITQTEVRVDTTTGEIYSHPRHFVFVVEDSMAKFTRVRMGLESRNRVEIVEGLKEGDRVIVVGQKVVKDEQPVRIVRK